MRPLIGKVVKCIGCCDVFKPVVEIDVKAESFKPGKPNYHRVIKSFEERSELKFDILLTWDPHGK